MPPEKDKKQLSMEELRGMIGEVVDEKISTMTKVDIKHGAFPHVPEDQLGKNAWAENFKIFLRAISQGDVALASDTAKAWTTKAQLEGTDTSGGFLVPEEFRAEVLRLGKDYGVIRRYARTIPMASETLRVPRETTAVSVYWPGEATAGTESNVVFGQVLLTAKKLVGLSTIASELLEDAGVDVIAYLTKIFAEAIAGEEDNQGFNGTGSPFEGVLTVSGVNNTGMTGHTFAELLLTELMDVQASVTTAADVGARWVFHKSILAILRKITVGNDYALSPGWAGDPPSLLGAPFTTSSKMPSSTAVSTPFVFYGNLQHILLGDRGGMTIAIGTEGTVNSQNLFEQDMKALRVTQRESIVVGIPAAFGKATTAAS